MHTFITEVRQTLIPSRSGKDGPLPPLLVAMTLVTGLVDAFSYLVLGHVFVANMTGNVVFLGFALAGAPGFSIGASVVALASFCLGALVGGQAGKRYGAYRGRLLSMVTAVEAVLPAPRSFWGSWSGSPVTAGFRYPLIFVLATAMGVQNAAVSPGRRPRSDHHRPHHDNHRHRRRQHDRRRQGLEIGTAPRCDRRHAGGCPRGSGVRPARPHRDRPGGRPGVLVVVGTITFMLGKSDVEWAKAQG